MALQRRAQSAQSRQDVDTAQVGGQRADHARRTFEVLEGGATSPVPYLDEMERLFGQDFHDVSARTGLGDELRQGGMNAAAEGDTVLFADASPTRDEVAHELAHVVQHRQGGAGGVSRPGDASEQEAHAVGAAAARGEPVTVEGASGGLHGSWLGGIWDSIKGAAQGAWNGAKKVVSGAWNWLTGGSGDKKEGDQPAPTTTTTPTTTTAPPPTTAPTTTTAPPVVAQGPIVEEQLTAVSTAAVGAAPASLQEYATRAIPGILRQCALSNLRNANQVAYVLATAQHESAFGKPLYGRSESLVEDRNPISQGGDGAWHGTDHVTGRAISGATLGEAETNYWDDAYGGRLGNVKGTTDGANYRGRGYVQITGRSNYERMSGKLNAEGFSYTLDGQTYGGSGNPPVDLVANPTHVNRCTDLAARIMVLGMSTGSFTGKGLNDYINDQQTDFVNARRIVNGDTATNGEKIATSARNYQAAIGGTWASVFRAQ